MARVEDQLPDADMTFATFFANWGTANYVHKLADVPSQFNYVDSDQLDAVSGGTLEYPDFILDKPVLNTGVAGGLSGVVTMQSYANHYIVVQPQVDVEYINVDIEQTSNSQVIYTLLLIASGSLVDHVRVDGSRNFLQTVQNNGYDEVVMVVTSLSAPVDFSYSFSAVDLTLNILDPLTPVQVGSPTNPGKFLIVFEIVDHISGIRAPIGGLSKLDVTVTVDTVTADLSGSLPFDYIGGSCTLAYILRKIFSA